MIEIYESYNLYLEPYYNNDNNYYHILTINKLPYGPLSNFVKLMAIKNVSTKINKANENYCSYTIKNTILSNINNYKLQICTFDDINEIIDFLTNNNYILNTNISELLSKYESKKLLLNFKYKIN
tara:strand:- start:4199 stop:4573 length:375 start_codon:yes stop_codon:yes gene_type:complete